MHSKRIVTGDSEIEKQLDDLLGQDSPTGLSPSDSKMESPSVSPLTSLKSIVLSMDWEINDPILKEFIQERWIWQRVEESFGRVDPAYGVAPALA